MKKNLAYVSALLTGVVMAVVLQLSFAAPAKADPSCQGQCKASYNGCVSRAKSTAEAAQCNKAYQGCISSCK